MLLSTTLLLSTFAAGPVPQQGDLLLQPDAIVAADGTLQSGMVVQVRDGRIVAVTEAKDGQQAIALEGVLAPGMIDAFSGRGADRLLTEQSQQLTPDLRAADGLQLTSPVWDSLLARGITAVHVTPDPTNVLAGWGAVVSTGGDLGQRVLAPQTKQIASLVTSSVTDNRVGPSSLAGALEILEQAMAHPETKDLSSQLWCFLENAEGARGVQQLVGKQPFTPILMGELGSYGGLFAGNLVGIPTMSYAGLARRAETWRRMHKAGVAFAFGTRAGNREWDSLRTSAMAFSRFTGDAAAAWASVTSNPAKMLGMEKEMGSIQAGARADLVLWSAHPLDATARVEAVLIGGKTVYRATGVEQ